MNFKLSLTTLLLLFNFFFLNAQKPCATEYPKEMEIWLENFQANRSVNIQKRASSNTFYVPIVAHIVGTDQGAGFYRSDYLLDAMCNVNDQFEDVNFYFYLQDVRYISNSNLYEHTGNYISVIEATKVSGALNMYFVQDPNGACGYFSGWRDYIAINKSCGAIDNSTIAHEIGHYMSLPHTFYGWENRDASESPRSTDERVNGSNCSTAGDRFCDTPADYISDRWNCPYSGTKTDFVGDVYQPDGELFMSYANDACQNYFSTEQIAAMRGYLQSQRADHLGYVPPNLAPLQQTELVFPSDTSSYKPPVNQIYLKWKAVPDADFYSVMLTQGSNPNFFLMDTIVRDTIIKISGALLQPFFSYRWRVAGFYEGNTCAGYTDFSSFTASSPLNFSPEVTVSPETCVGNDGEVELNMTGSGAPFSYEWSNGFLGSNQLNLSAGSYFVTITSNSNETLIIPVEVPDAGDLSVDIISDANKLVLDVDGGIGPYTYLWSDNSVTETINLSSSQGTYRVTVTDALGCSVSEVYNVNSIEDIDELDAFKLYPNPLSAGSAVNIQFTASEQKNFQMEIVDLSGKKVLSKSAVMSPGQNNFSISMNGISKGVYILRMSGEKLNINKKLYLY